MIKEVVSENAMKALGQSIGALLNGGETIELIGDVGAGKTTLTKAIAVGLGVNENVQSPSFTINRVYAGRDGLVLSHYDFYRLNDAGIMANDLGESTNDKNVVTVVEWGEIVDGVLPLDRLTIRIVVLTEDTRQIIINAGGDVSKKIQEQIK